MISTTEELYGIGVRELNRELYFTIMEVINSKLSNVEIGDEMSKRLSLKRILLLKLNRDKLLIDGIMALSKKNDRIVNDIDKAIKFWERSNEN